MKNALEKIQEFENIIKEYGVLFFDKVKEKDTSGWKLVYTIQGLTFNNFFFTNLKFIFWLDKDMKILTDNVITYLYTQYCVYETQTLSNDLTSQFENILNRIKNEKTNVNLNDLFLNGSDEMNKIFKRDKIDNFIHVVNFIPDDEVKSCLMTSYKYNIETLNNKYLIELKIFKNVYVLIYKNEKYQISFDDIYEKIIEIIFK